MKKIIVSFLFLSALIFSANAQQLVSKNGTPILPEKGDWAIGVSVNPFLDYIGGLFSDEGASSPEFNFFGNDNVLMGKYFTSDKTAIRGMLRIGLNSNTWKNFVEDEATTAPDQVLDKVKLSETAVALGAGYEMRRGKGRLQGFYGGQVMLSFMGEKEKYTYGNEFTSTNTDPLTTDFFGDLRTPFKTIESRFNAFEVNSRYTEINWGSSFGVGLGAFIGAEYFILPKISLGGQFGWGINFMTGGEGKITTEYWDGVSNSVKTIESKMANDGNFSIDTDNLSGDIFLMLHF